MTPNLLDLRPQSAFLAGHAAGAANIPLEELSLRVHELPPRGHPLVLVDADPTRAERGAVFLRGRGHGVEIAPFDPAQQTETGPPRGRLWKPSPFLVECLGRIERRDRALDVACGTGRDAVWLALAGFDVTAIDVLPDALRRAADLAQRNGVRLNLVQQDLSRDPRLPTGFDLVTVFRYLDRSLFPAIRAAIAPGGCLVYETFHERTRQTGRSPRDPAHLVRTGELPNAFAGMRVLIARDEVERQGRFFSQLLARTLVVQAAACAAA